MIRPSNSEYASPIVLTRKKSGDLRLCIEYRALNKITLRDNYPLPLIDDQLDALEGKKYFSLLDLNDGFHHLDVAPDSIKLTSFVTPFGEYEYLKMPFGLKTAPATFQRVVNTAFADLIKSGKISVYIDDVMIATRTLEEQIEVLTEVFRAMTENKMELKLEKCSFLYTEIKFLGYVVSAEGIRPSKKGLEAIEGFPEPQTVLQLQRFLGLCQYFRKYVEGFAVIAKPLYDLLKKDTVFVFGESQVNAFETLKGKLTEKLLLAIYNPRDPAELHCDASSVGFGSVLLQRKEDGRFHPIFFFSKRTTECESKYHSFELEMLSIIYARERACSTWTR